MVPIEEEPPAYQSEENEVAVPKEDLRNAIIVMLDRSYLSGIISGLIIGSTLTLIIGGGILARART